MEPLLAIAFGVILSASAYLILSRNVLRMVLGLILLGNAANLSIFLSGRLVGPTPPIVAAGGDALVAGAANPLPQALILTAIVIGFAFVSFVLVLVHRAHGALGTLDTEAMREAEPAHEPPQPMPLTSPAPRKEAA